MAINHPVILIYDRQCPACEYYARMLRIRADIGPLELVNAREGGPWVDEVTRAGMDIDQGMVVKVGNNLFYGSDAAHALALMSTQTGLFNRLCYWCFRSQRMARISYPLLRALRNLLLKLLGRTKINNLGLEDNHRF